MSTQPRREQFMWEDIQQLLIAAVITAVVLIAGAILEQKTHFISSRVQVAAPNAVRPGPELVPSAEIPE